MKKTASPPWPRCFSTAYFDEGARRRGRARGRLREVSHDVTQLQSSGSGQSLTYLCATPDESHVHTYAAFACHACIFSTLRRCALKIFWIYWQTNFCRFCWSQNFISTHSLYNLYRRISWKNWKSNSFEEACSIFKYILHYFWNTHVSHTCFDIVEKKSKNAIFRSTCGNFKCIFINKSL